MAVFKSDGKAILIAFIGAIITIALILAISNQVTLNTTGDVRVDNVTVACPSAANSTTDIEGRSFITNINISDADVQTFYDSRNYTIITGTSPTTGLLSAQLYVNDTGYANCSISGDINLTYTFVPDGYVGGSNVSITLLIIIFSAVAILIFVIVTFMESGTLGKLIGRS